MLAALQRKMQRTPHASLSRSPPTLPTLPVALSHSLTP